MIHGFPNPFEFDIALIDPVHAMMHRGFRIDQKKSGSIIYEPTQSGKTFKQNSMALWASS